MRHEDELSKNPRIGMGYQLLKKMPEREKSEIREQAQSILKRIEHL
jgi:deoxyribodipyrimidine photolyase-like uncharacterized protein